MTATDPAPQKTARTLKRSEPRGTSASRLPQVNLLPPEVRAARSLSTVKRWLGLVLVLVLVLVALGYVAAVVDRSQAEDELTAADDERVALLAEQAKYAEVPRVLTAISQTEAALTSGLATEIGWKAYVDAITAVLPAGMSVDEFALNGPSPMTAAVASADPLQGQSIGDVSLQLRSTTAPSTADLLDALDALPGLESPWVSSVAVAEDDGSVYYAVSVSVQVNEFALAGRFAEGAGTEGGE